MYFTEELCVVFSEGSVMDHGVLAQLTQLYMTVKLECPFYRVCIHGPGTLNRHTEVLKKKKIRKTFYI